MNLSEGAVNVLIIFSGTISAVVICVIAMWLGRWLADREDRQFMMTTTSTAIGDLHNDRISREQMESEMVRAREEMRRAHEEQRQMMHETRRQMYLYNESLQSQQRAAISPRIAEAQQINRTALLEAVGANINIDDMRSALESLERSLSLPDIIASKPSKKEIEKKINKYELQDESI